MTIFLKSLGYTVWIIVERQYKLPTTEAVMDENQTKEEEINAKAMNALLCALGTNEFNRISQCTTTNEIWTTLSTAYKGTSKVKKVRLNLQRTNYEAFKFGTNETITEMFTRLMEIVNTMKSHGETFTDEMVVEKILIILPASWNSPLAAIEESKDLKDYDLKEFLGSLMMYEATMFMKSELKKNQ